MAKLDKSRPYGEVVGECDYRFEQDHKFFDTQGNEVKPKVQEVDLKEANVETKREVAKTASTPTKTVDPVDPALAEAEVKGKK